MNKTLASIALVVTLFAAPAMAAKIYIDYDKQAPYTTYKTWAYKETADGKVDDPLMDDRIVKGLEEMLAQGTLKQVDSNPDLWATYSTTSETRTQYNTTHFGYAGGYGRYGRYGWGGGASIGTSQTTATTYTDGTLIVDIWDAKTKELVWRGTATGTLKAKPEKIAKQIDKFYTQMWDKWQKTVAKVQKEAGQ